ncbi:MAG: hypothetical protein IJH12_07010 [Clostridia bacterium]|nr:hypothetical protein [Clostridia bacterium]
MKKNKVLEIICIVLVFVVYTTQSIIFRLLGYRRIEDLKIPADRTRPREQNIQMWKNFYKEFYKLPAIVIDKNNFILSGFSRYIAACELDFEFVKVTKVRSHRLRKRTRGRVRREGLVYGND